MEQRVLGKVAIVTGAGRGIGKGVALHLAREGADVVVADIDRSTAEQVAQEIRQFNQRALAYYINLRNISEIQLMVTTVVEEFGKIDILVNNAGVVQSTPFLDVTEEDWDRISEINQRSVVFCIQAVAKQMIKQIPDEVKTAGKADRSYGKIVNFSSISGRHGRAYQVAYSASKAAIISITQSAAMALAPYNINVNAIAPSVVLTPMWEQNVQEKSRMFGVDAAKESQDFIERIPLKRAGSEEDMAGAVAFLCSSDADYITGQTLNVDGGFEMN